MVLDDHPLWVEALEQLLHKVNIRVVARTTRVEDVLPLVEEHQPDLLITEFEISSGSSFVLSQLRRAHELHPPIKWVVLSAHDAPQQIEAAFAAGAAVYCLKTAPPEDLAAAIRQAFDNSIYFARPQAQLVGQAETASGGERAPELTRRELEILQLVAEGYSNAQLAGMLWVTEQTVKFHLSNIYRKLEVANRTEASRWAQLNGLLSADSKNVATTAA
jgi:DNA-binding NarL/FixJ family response regulator